uniref:Uncharacterized protein n=1 Tax=Anguilla anguilla TaxID=7936 RepID=A0A0E9TCF0_ANGAN
MFCKHTQVYTKFKLFTLEESILYPGPSEYKASQLTIDQR